MAEPSILSFNYSDDQLEIVRKLNYNFEQISAADGGVQGPIGPTGATGLIGQIGPIGPTGNTGPRGSRWFVGGIEAPTGGYGDVTVEGDYWIDTDAIEKTLYVFGPSGWLDTGYDLIPEDEFKFIPDLITATGATSNFLAIVQNTLLPSSNTFVLSDGNPSIELTNPDYTNFLITTDPGVNQYPIMEFSRSDATIIGASGYFKRPIWRWTGGDNDYNLAFAVPSDRLTILTKSGITGTVTNKANFQADDSLFLTSKSTIDFTSGGPSFFNTPGSLGITASNLSLNSTRLETDADLKIQTIPGKSPSNDPVFGNYSLWIDNPSGTSLFLGATGIATGGNHLMVAKKDQTNLLEVRSDGVFYAKKRTAYNKRPVFNSSNSISIDYGSGLIISWYFITASSLSYNNTFLIDVNPANDIGVAVNVRSGDGDNVMNLLEKYQSMKINVLTSTNDPMKKIKYLGYYTGSPPLVGQYIKFGSGLNQAELEVLRGDGITATSSRILYSSNQGSGRLL